MVSQDISHNIISHNINNKSTLRGRMPFDLVLKDSVRNCVIYILPLLLSYKYDDIVLFCGVVLRQAAFSRVNFCSCRWPFVLSFFKVHFNLRMLRRHRRAYM